MLFRGVLTVNFRFDKNGSITVGSHRIKFKYNDQGIRTEKTVNGVTTKYHLVGGSVTYEDNGKDKIHYTYDSSGKLISMNLNGEEYYYVRNAQGDIIGLINAQGEKVVSYTYDSWGKLISIERSLKDTVGEKNPYRYRGYRYDSETGLYYLQNRYYNPEWGRFINADGIIGETGELLGHNLFAYSKNNWANRSDYSGFRPVYTLGEETEAMRAASYAVMNRTVINRTIRNKREKSSIIPKRNQVTGTIRNAIITGIEGGASSILSKIPKAIPIITNRALRRAGREFIVPVKGASVARGIGGIEKIGAIGVALTGVAIWDNYHSGYSNSEAFGRSAIDVLVSAGVIAFGVSNPVGWTMGLGFAAGLAAEALKNAIWKKE